MPNLFESPLERDFTSEEERREVERELRRQDRWVAQNELKRLLTDRDFQSGTTYDPLQELHELIRERDPDELDQALTDPYERWETIRTSWGWLYGDDEE